MIWTFGYAYRRAWFYYALQRLKLPCFLLLVLVGGRFLSCSKKHTEFQPTDPLGFANKWVYDSMKLYYYWADQMTKKPDYNLPTHEFYKQLLSSEDRFSWISNRADIKPPQLTIQLYGFGYALINHPFKAGQLAGVVTQVISISDAATRVALKRGMFFTKVNDKVITEENMASVISDLESSTNSNVMLQLAELNANGTALNDSVRVAVKQKTVPLKSVYTSGMYQKNGINTGYLPYFLCDEKDDGTLLQKITNFKDNGITEMILDLRYNPGGSVASVSKLAAVLVPALKPDNTFITYKGNRYGGTVKMTFKQAVAFSGNVVGKDVNYLLSLNLGLKRIYIITSAATASAAELLTNNLKPYMQVKLIGENTMGKDEASFTIEDTRSPRQVEWMLEPIVYKVTDVNGRGGYSNGITPDYVVNEFSKLPIAELGMPGDLPVEKALELIYGTSQLGFTPVRRNVRSFTNVHAVFYSSQSRRFNIAAPY
jgi:carboxyl-terminal processing protease